MDSKRLQPKKVLLWITAFLLHFHSIFSFTFNKPSLSSVLPSERHIITTAHHLFSNPKKHHNGVTGGSDGGGGGVNARESTEARNAEADLQWKLFQRYHAIVESDTVQTDDDDTTTSAEAHWRGTWTTHDYIGDVVDEVVASVDYSIPQESVSSEEVMQTHTIITSEKVSDCKTCFDSKDTKTFPVALHRYGDFGMSNQDIDKNNVRCASCAMVSGPTVLRSTGAMCTELVLSHGSKHRLRVAFQHGPVWKAEEQKEEGEDGDPQRPPDGLRLFRTTVSRETLGWVGGDDAVSDGQYGDPAMRRGVPPFFWHNKWAGTSWTWGPTTGDRGWQIEELEDIDGEFYIAFFVGSACCTKMLKDWYCQQAIFSTHNLYSNPSPPSLSFFLSLPLYIYIKTINKTNKQKKHANIYLLKSFCYTHTRKKNWKSSTLFMSSMAREVSL